METKIAIKFDNVTLFGSYFFYVMDKLSCLGMPFLIGDVLGLRCISYGYQCR